MSIDHNKATTVKSTLAKLLAMENISIRHVLGTTTATFDMKSRILRLPVWENISEDLYDMLVVHEVGHALETPGVQWMTEIERLAEKHNPKPGNLIALEKTKRSFHGFVNIVEDVRIDVKQRKRYPGSRRNYVLGYKELMERDFFKTKENPIKGMSFINRLNVHSKAGFSNIVIVPFSDEEKVLVNRAFELDTFAETTALAEELWLLAREKDENSGAGEGQEGDESEDSGDDSESKNPGKDQKAEDESEDEGEGEGSESEQETSDDGQDSDTRRIDPTTEKSEESDETGESESEKTDGEGGEKGEQPLIPPEAGEETEAEAEGEAEADEEKAEGEAPKRENFGGELGADSGGQQVQPEDDLPESDTDEYFKDGLDSLAKTDGIAYYYSTIPEVLENQWFDYKEVLADHVAYQGKFPAIAESMSIHQNNLNKFKVEENKSISFMVKEFEMRKQADAYAKSAVSKTGVINTNKLHSYHYNDDIFKRNLTVPNGKSHGFVMFVDWSSSMMSDLANTTKQLFSIVLFCKRIGVPFEVYTFTSGSDITKYKDTGPFLLTSESIQFSGKPHIRNVLSSRMNATELNAGMLFLFAQASTRTAGYDRNTMVPVYCPPNDYMSGTPLNETIVIAEKIINTFKKNTNVQMTNVVFLTDGEGSSPSLGTNDYNLRARRYQIMIQDPKTKHEYLLPAIGDGSSYRQAGNSGFDWTNVFLKFLKERTGCTLVGFYLLEKYYASHTGSMWASKVFQGNHEYQNPETVKKARNSWNKHGFVEVQNSGYDEYYLISSGSLNLTRKEFKIDSSKFTDKKKITVNKLAKQFTDHMVNKVSNRKMLGSFIKKIA